MKNGVLLLNNLQIVGWNVRNDTDLCNSAHDTMEVVSTQIRLSNHSNHNVEKWMKDAALIG